MSFVYSIIIAVICSFSYQSEIPYATIEKAFLTANPTEIIELSKDKMLLSVMGKEGAYSHSQATLVLRDFFTRKPVNSFKFNFKGKENKEGSFAVGTYVSKTENFRVTIHFKKEGEAYKIESLTIEKS